MNQTFIISDLHLCESRPSITRIFLDFIHQRAPEAERLFILGDFFEYWAGDDDLEDSHHIPVTTALRTLSTRGTAISIMHGNRDFLLGKAFADACGAELIPDPYYVDLHGRPTLLTHGDLMCTDDVEYQNFRTLVRDLSWQQNFLSLPLSQRKAQIAELRARSEKEKSIKDAGIMDVNAGAVMAMLREHGYPKVLIHGHTHRPGFHRVEVDGRHCERIVLADWGVSGSYLSCNDSGCEAVTLT